MATLQLFMTLEELDKTIQDFANRRNMLGILRTRQGYSPYSLTKQPSEFLVRHKDIVDVYLLPEPITLSAPLSEKTFSPRQLGAIQIIPGGLVKKKNTEVLLLTSISAEDREGLAFKPAAWLRQFKKRMQTQGTVVFGVEGVNAVYGGRERYKNIGYSTSAINLYQSGVLWKQYVDDNSEFSPLNDDDIELTSA